MWKTQRLLVKLLILASFSVVHIHCSDANNSKDYGEKVLNKLEGIEMMLEAQQTESDANFIFILKTLKSQSAELKRNLNELSEKLKCSTSVHEEPKAHKKAKRSADLAGKQEKNSYADCTEALKNNKDDGVYTLKLSNASSSTFKAFCLTDPKGEGSPWTLIMRSQNNSANSRDFNRTLEEYKNGFGDPHDNFWLGLNNLFHLTNSSKYEFWSKLKQDGEEANIHSVGHFQMEDESEDYALTLRVLYDDFTMVHCFKTPFMHENIGSPFSGVHYAGYWFPCLTKTYEGKKVTKEVGLLSIDLDKEYSHMAIRPIA